MAAPVNNFPPLPKFIRLKPCFYQNFEDEIPIEQRGLVIKIYRLWMFYCITLAVNLIACLAWWIGGGSGINFGFAFLWLVLFSPCSYICWFRPLYKAFRSDSSFNFMAFFFILGAQFILAAIQAIGFSGWGACGWLAAILFFSTNVGAAVIMLFPAIMFTLSAVVMALAIIKVVQEKKCQVPDESIFCLVNCFCSWTTVVHRLYRNGGGSFQKAQEEWNTGNWKNPPTREAQYSNFSGNSLPEYPTVPNYPVANQWP